MTNLIILVVCMVAAERIVERWATGSWFTNISEAIYAASASALGFMIGWATQCAS